MVGKEDMKETKNNTRDENGMMNKSKKYLEPLLCDECGKKTGITNQYGDFNGLEFYCDECYERLPEYYFR